MTGGAFVVWNETFSVENGELDGEHRKIMSALNRLHCMEKEGIDVPMLKSILQDLLRYTEQHCAHEETLMLQWKYSGYEEQRAAHQGMIGQTRQLVESPLHDEQNLFDRSVTLLNQWWVSHIQTLDREYVVAMHEFERQRGTERGMSR